MVKASVMQWAHFFPNNNNKIENNKMKETKQQIVNYALNFLLSNIDETTEEDLGMTAEQIERAIENEKEAR